MAVDSCGERLYGADGSLCSICNLRNGPVGYHGGPKLDLNT